MLTNLRIDAIAALALLVVLVAGCAMVLAPFLSAILWAVIMCYSTWGLYLALLRNLGGRSTLAAALMTLLLVSILVVPLFLVAVGVTDNAATVEAAIRRLIAQGPPEAPVWVAEIPLFGGDIARYWHEVTEDASRLTGTLRKAIAPVSRWLLETGLAFGGGLLFLLLSVVTAFFFYRDGAEVATRLSAALDRIGGERAQHLLRIAGGTVKGVVYGLIGTALAQGILAGFGFWLAGVPGPIFLGLLTCFFSVVPVGPPIIWLSATAWLVHEEALGWAVFMFLWGMLVVSTVDNVLKPILIGRGARLPFILVLLGVAGGALAFGLIGVFLGPVLLAVGYNLIREWTQARPAIPTPPPQATV